MKTKNKIDLIGFVGRAPDITSRSDGSSAVLDVRFSLATTARWNDADGRRKERTEWHRIVFWDRAVDQLAKFLHAGSFLEVEGSMQSSVYEKDGFRRRSWQMRDSECRLLDRAPGDALPEQSEEPAAGDDTSR
jgi:single-strand DNA-binding protein